MTNLNLNNYREKVKKVIEKKSIEKTVFFFSYALIVFVEALEQKGHTIEEYKFCDLLNSLHQLQRLSVKKRKLFTPFIEMSSTVSYWINNGQEDTRYIEESTAKIESKLNDSVSNAQWEQFYSIFKDMMMEHSNGEESIHIPIKNPIQKVVQAPNTDLPKPWLSDVKNLHHGDLPKPWLAYEKSLPKKKR